MHKKILFFIIVFSATYFSSFSQVKQVGNPYIKNYSLDDYSNEDLVVSTQNWSVYQDNKGIMYFGNTNGILIFDGTYWELIEMPNNSTVRSIKQGSDGKIYVGAEGEFGILSNDGKGKLVYKSLLQNNSSVFNFADVWNIFSVKNKIVFETNKRAFILDKQKDTLYSHSAKGNILNSYKSKDRVYFFNSKQGLLKLTENGLTEISSHQIFKSYGTAIHGFDNNFIIVSREYGFYKFKENSIDKWNVKGESKILEKEPYCGVKIDSEHIAVGTQLGGIFIINSKGKVVQVFNKENGLQANTVYGLFLDKNNNLWAALGNGISYFKINSPFSYFNRLYNIPQKNYSVEYLKGKVYFGNEVGVYTKPLATANNDLYINKFSFIKGSEGQIWELHQHENRLIAAHNGSVLLIDDNKVVSRILENENIWHIRRAYNQNGTYFAFTGEGIYSFKVDNNKLLLLGKYEGFNGECRYAEVENDSTLWVTNYIDGIKRLTVNTKKQNIKRIKQFTVENGLPQNSLNLPSMAMNTVYIATTKGIYEIVEDSIIPAEDFNKQYNLSGQTNLFYEDNWKRTWVQDNLNLKLITKNKKLIQTPFNRFHGQNLSRINVVNEENIFFAGDKYVVHYDPTIPFEEDTTFNVHIKSIINLKNDSVIAGGYRHLLKDSLKNLNLESGRLILPNKFNNLRFEFSSSYYEKPEETKYKVWLSGFEDNNLNWSDEIKKDYTNLPPGEYVFHLKAQNIYNLKSSETTFEFEILPPWYRSALAYFIYVILFIFFIYLMARLYANKVKKDKKKLENIVYRSTEEIRKQNEEILYQNSKILKQKEEIQEKAKQLESANAELEKLSIVASETNNAVVIANKDGRVEWINQGFVRLYGYTLEELRSHYGTYLQNFNPNADFSKIKPDNKKKSRESVFESVIKTKNDEIVEVQTTLTPIYNEQGEIFKYVVIDTDIRDLKRYENELKKLVTTKDKFFSIIAHDLKNPFNSILGATSILIKKKDKLDKERIQYFHENIYNVAQQGYDLLENLLEWARSQTGRLDLKFERLNLYDLSNEAIDILRSNADNKHIEIINKINKNYEVVADKNTVKTVFRNLLSNAIKYTNPKGKVILNAESEGKYKKVSISDTGIGIPKKYLSKIFKVDVQYSRKGTAEESGTGLGLILCKEFVEKNNGKIFVQSIEGEGSIFYFTLPDKQKNS